MADQVRRIGRVNVAVLDRDEARTRVVAASKAGGGQMICFCNAHTVNLAHGDRAFSDVLDEAALVLNDGIGLDLASLMLHGRFFPENLNGTDFSEYVLAGLDESVPVFLLGSRDGIARHAAGILHARYPALRIVGTHHGFFDLPDDEIVRRIRASGAKLLLVGMGQPRQELWAARLRDQWDGAIMCIGAYFDFVSGTVPRARPWVRALRSEWVHRLLHEPRRLAQRYLLGNPRFLWIVLQQRLSTADRA